MPQRTPLDPAVEWVEFGTTDADWDAAEPHLLTSMLSQLVLIRTFEEFVLELAGEGLIHGPAHSSIGQEGGAVGSVIGLTTQDTVNGSHRGHHQFLAKVLSLLKLAIYLSAHNPKVNEVKFRAHDAPNPQVDSNLYVNNGDLKAVYRQFMNPEATAVPVKTATKPESSTTKATKKKRRPASQEPVGGLDDARTEGENMAVLADPKLEALGNWGGPTQSRLPKAQSRWLPIRTARSSSTEPTSASRRSSITRCPRDITRFASSARATRRLRRRFR